MAVQNTYYIWPTKLREGDVGKVYGDKTTRTVKHDMKNSTSGKFYKEIHNCSRHNISHRCWRGKRFGTDIVYSMRQLLQEFITPFDKKLESEQ